MLKNISSLLDGDLLKILSDMGHGDEIVLVDANYPGITNAKRYLRYSGVGMVDLLKAVLSVIPLDHIVPDPAVVMSVADKDRERGITTPPIWAEFSSVLSAEGYHMKLREISRPAFYERSKDAFAIIQTGEKALYANIILTKGVI